MKKTFFMFSLLFLMVIWFQLHAKAEMYTSISDSSSEWSYVTIINKSDTNETIDQLLLFLHGSGRNNNYTHPEKYLVKDLGGGYGPVFYEQRGELLLPARAAIVCPEAQADWANGTESDFMSKPEKLLKFINKLKGLYPNAQICVVGHSLGAYAVYQFCSMYPEAADKWVLISGGMNSSLELPADISLMVVGTTSEICSIYDEQFFTQEVTTRPTKGVYIDATENAYATLACSHGETPQVFLEVSFWKWVFM